MFCFNKVHLKSKLFRKVIYKFIKHMLMSMTVFSELWSLSTRANDAICTHVPLFKVELQQPLLIQESHTEQDHLTGAEIKHAVMTSVSGVCKNAGYIHYNYVTISDVCKTVGYVDT